MTAYYNEFDPGAAAWLRELIKRGLLPEGDVDERTIEDVQPVDLLQYTQCHFFAGIGGWPLALRQAGWPDDLPVWTGSPPCQPFSDAGKRKGTKDKRHLWPDFFRLIKALHPLAVFGEQVASKDGQAWLGHVQSDMEGEGFTFGAAMFPACGIGAPHQRMRTYFTAHTNDRRLPQLSRVLAMAHANREGQHRERILLREGTGGREEGDIPQDSRRCEDNFVANAANIRCNRSEEVGHCQRERPCRPKGGGEKRRTFSESAGEGGDVWLADSHSQPSERRAGGLSGEKETCRCEWIQHGHLADRHTDGGEDDEIRGGERRDDLPHEANGFWSDADWILCRDGKWRAVEPGTQPLVDGIPARVVRLRGYGNAIVVPQAQAFIESFIEIIGEGNNA